MYRTENPKIVDRYHFVPQKANTSNGLVNLCKRLVVSSILTLADLLWEQGSASSNLAIETYPCRLIGRPCDFDSHNGWFESTWGCKWCLKH